VEVEGVKGSLYFFCGSTPVVRSQYCEQSE